MIASDTTEVLLEVREERKRQDVKWGRQNHEPLFWLGIIGEEYGEACKATIESIEGTSDLEQLRHELIQVAASAVAAVEYLDRVEL